jgi:hypothetical protein
MQFDDNVRIKIGSGTGGDLRIYHDGSNSYIEDSGTGDLIISGDNDVTIKDGTGNLLFNGNASNSVELYFGGSKKFETTSTGVSISSTGAGAIATVEAGDANQASLDLKNTEGHYRLITDGGELKVFDQTDSNQPLTINTSGNVGIGTTSPTNLLHLFKNATQGSPSSHTPANATLRITDSANTVYLDGNSIIAVGADNFLMGNTTAADFVLFTNATERMRITSAGNATFAGNVSLADSKNLKLGTGQDLELFHSGTESFISNATGHLTIQNSADDKDIIFKSDDGSGGTTEYFRLDGGLGYNVADQHIQMTDGKAFYAGSGNDLGIFHNGTQSKIENLTGDLTIEQFADDKDIIFKSDDGSGGTTEYFKLDGSQTIIDVATRTLFRDSVKATFGAGYDLVIYHDGSNSYVQQQGTGDLIIRNSADDKDIIFQSDDGSGGTTEYFRLNGDNSDVIFSKPIELEDSVELRIGGSGADLRFFHSTNSFMQNFVGDLQIEQHTNDKDIFLRCDDGSGGVTTYILLDGSEVATKIETVKIFMPNLPTSDPSVAGQLYNDSGTLKISAG